ncbi:MAG: tRNA pseudouridine(55) synthase TruB [Prevotellaceae bacterium]|jgi:tRNA pseudouridine55 synthase|nr:tRNA pseudouridine(55) synthase TruB [Prevotellaceae bacterium]
MISTPEFLEDGLVLPLDKPYGWSSFDAIRFVQRSIQKKFGIKKFKIGHAGTLDPLATGVLVVCLGKATKQVELLQAEKKEYLVDICLGATTPSFDLETEPEQVQDTHHITFEQIRSALDEMLGEQEQIPPMFSAKIINGKRAYTLARKGQVVDIKSNKINIFEIQILEFNNPHITILVSCSKGTYIRSLARDLGERLECGAYLTGLRRTVSGSFNEANLQSIENYMDFILNYNADNK